MKSPNSTNDLAGAIDRALKDRPQKITVQTHEGFLELCRRAEAGAFQICAMDVGKPGGEFKYRLELSWPANQQTFL